LTPHDSLAQITDSVASSPMKNAAMKNAAAPTPWDFFLVALVLATADASQGSERPLEELLRLGIDVAKDTLHCTLLDPATRRTLWSRTYSNTAGGLARLLKATQPQCP
jgi:hypothetical protein